MALLLIIPPRRHSRTANCLRVSYGKSGIKKWTMLALSFMNFFSLDLIAELNPQVRASLRILTAISRSTSHWFIRHDVKSRALNLDTLVNLVRFCVPRWRRSCGMWFDGSCSCSVQSGLRNSRFHRMKTFGIVFEHLLPMWTECVHCTVFVCHCCSGDTGYCAFVPQLRKTTP